jgi:hypothetical protein
MGQKKPSEKVLPGVSALLMEPASQVQRRTKEIARGLASGWGRDQDRDAAVRVPAREQCRHAQKATQNIARGGRRRMFLNLISLQQMWCL